LLVEVAQTQVQRFLLSGGLMIQKRLVLLNIFLTILLCWPTSIALANTDDSDGDEGQPSEASVYDAYSNIPYWINLVNTFDVTFAQPNLNDVAILLRVGAGPKFLVHTKSKGFSISFTPLLQYSRAELAWPGQYYRFEHSNLGPERFDFGHQYQGSDVAADGIGATLTVGMEWHLSRVRWGLFVGVGVDHFVPPDEMANYKPATLLNTFIGVEFWPPPLAPGFQMGLSVGFVAAQIPLIEGTSNFKNIEYMQARLSLTFLFDIHKIREDSIKSDTNTEAR